MTQNHPHAVIFDMDGVLFDSEGLHRRAWQAELGLLGFQITEEELLRWVGVGDSKYAEHFVRHEGLDLTPADLLRPKREKFKRLVTAELKPFPQLIHKIETLRAGGWPLALCTSGNRDECHHMLSCAGLLEIFRVRICGDDVARHKPHPEPYLSIVQRLEMEPDHCYVIEDSPSGLQSASEAGCRVLGVTTSFGAEELSLAQQIFPSTVAAIDFILAQQEQEFGGTA